MMKANQRVTNEEPGAVWIAKTETGGICGIGDAARNSAQREEKGDSRRD